MRAAYVIGRACAVCDQPAKDLGHVTPVSRAGRTTRADLQPLCRDCNLRKSDR